MYTVHTVHCILFTPCTVYCSHREMYTVHTVHCILFTPCTVYCSHRALYTVHTVHCTLFTPCTVYCSHRALYTVHTVHCILFTPCTVNNQLTTLSPTQCTVLFTDILYYNNLLVNPTCFNPSWDHHQGITLK
jgi:hypothetical protein